MAIEAINPSTSIHTIALSSFSVTASFPYPGHRGDYYYLEHISPNLGTIAETVGCVEGPVRGRE